MIEGGNVMKPRFGLALLLVLAASFTATLPSLADDDDCGRDYRHAMHEWREHHRCNAYNTYPGYYNQAYNRGYYNAGYNYPGYYNRPYGNVGYGYNYGGGSVPLSYRIRSFLNNL